MRHNIPQIVSLKLNEKELLDRITFEFSHHNDDILSVSCEAAASLANSLLTREAIPDIRIRFFINPEYNIETQQSRLQIFESSGVTGHAIFKDPRFLGYLRYFIYGPNLPNQVIAEFCNLAYPYEYISGGEIEDLREMARSLTREHNLISKDVACEFFKLAIECRINVYSAQSIQNAVHTLK